MAISPTAAVQFGLGVVQGIGGLIGKDKAQDEIERLNAQRKAFVTPEAVFQQLQATQQNAQTGFGAETLNYLTNTADNAFSSGIGAIGLAGGDSNSMSALFDQRINESMRIAGQDTATRMANFSKYLGALNTVAENDAAEQVSRDNLIKDRIQAASAKGGDATKNISGGLSNILGGVAAQEQMELYDQNLSTTNQLGNLDFLNQNINPIPGANIYRTSDVYLGTPNNNPYLA